MDGYKVRDSTASVWDYAQSGQTPCAHWHLALSTELLSYRDLHPLISHALSGRGMGVLGVGDSIFREKKKMDG